MCLNKNITLLIFFFLNHLHRQSVTLLLYHYFLSKYHIKKKYNEDVFKFVSKIGRRDVRKHSDRAVNTIEYFTSNMPKMKILITDSKICV